MNKPFSAIIYTLLAAVVMFVFLSDGFRKNNDLDSITVWHWMTDRDDAFRELAKAYEEQTGIKVKFDLFAPSDAYAKKITASSQARILPDIYGVLGTKNVFADFIKYGFVADLTGEFEKNDAQWKRKIFEKALNTNSFVAGNVYGVKPGIYGVPLDVTSIQMLYNKNLLKKAGYSAPPKTFKEFVEVSKALNRVGVAGLVSGWGEAWMAECFASNYAFNIMGEDKVMATYRGEVSYTDADWIKVFEIFKTLVDNNMLVEGVVAKPNKEAEQDFALERAAFAFNGSWSVNVYHKMNPDLQYGVMLPPSVNPELPVKIWSWAGSSFVVSEHSPKKGKAIDFLKWLTDKEQQEYLARQTNNLPSNRMAMTEIPKILEEFAQGMDNTTHPTIWELNELPMVTERYGKGLQSILLGKLTPEQVAQRVQEAKILEMKKAAKRRQ